MLILRGTLARIGDTAGLGSLVSLDALAWRITKETLVFWLTPWTEVIARPIHTEVTLDQLDVYLEIFDSARAKTLEGIALSAPGTLGVRAFFCSTIEPELACIVILERARAVYPLSVYERTALDETVFEDEPTIPDVRIIESWED